MNVKTPEFRCSPPKPSDFEQFHAEDMTVRESYRLMTSLIVPRPIAFITTTNKNGTSNLAPFSFFNGVSTNPPTVCISFAFKPDGTKKDSLRNIEETGELVINGSHTWLANHISYAAADFEYGQSEVAASGLNTVESIKVTPPRIRESLWHMECKLHKAVSVGKPHTAGSSTLVIAEVLTFHVNSSVLKEGRIHASDLDPVARLGGLSYSELGNQFENKIPRINKKS